MKPAVLVAVLFWDRVLAVPATSRVASGPPPLVKDGSPSSNLAAHSASGADGLSKPAGSAVSVPVTHHPAPIDEKLAVLLVVLGLDSPEALMLNEAHVDYTDHGEHGPDDIPQGHATHPYGKLQFPFPYEPQTGCLDGFLIFCRYGGWFVLLAGCMACFITELHGQGGGVPNQGYEH